VIITALALGAACGGGGRDPAPATDQVSAPAARRVPPAVSRSDARTLLVTAHDYAFTGVPERVPAGWLRVRMVNVGRELHMLGIERVPAGHSAREIVDSLTRGRPAPEGQDWGGPNVVSPGDTATATLFFPPGQYVIACAVESADGKLHLAKGMLATFEVVPAPDSAAPPLSEDARVTLADYRVDLQGELRPGTRTLRVRNQATQGHDLEILEVLPGRSRDDALRWFEHPARGTPAARALGGVVAIHPGQDAFVTATLRPGTYLLLCWVPDAAGRPHFRRGMWRTATVPPPA
jgi:hypothetical protein